MSTADLYRPLDHSRSRDHSRQTTTIRSVGGASAGVSTRAWWTMFVATIIALTFSGYLTWSSLTSSQVAGCGGGGMFDCSHVLHSRWSKVLSIPVSIPAIATHSLILVLLLTRPINLRMRNVQWNVIGFAALAAGASAIWFIGLQVFTLRHLCPYCLVAHAAGLALAATFLWSKPVKKQSMKWITGVAAAALAALIALQVLAQPPSSFEVIDHTGSPAVVAPSTTNPTESDAEWFAPPESAQRQTSVDRSVDKWRAESLSQLVAAIANPATLMHSQIVASQSSDAKGNQSSDAKGKTARVLNGIELSTTDWPLVGKPDAELVFVEMFDYTCPHCQRTHRSIDAVRTQFGDRLAVITLPVPLDGKCNPTVRSTLASHREACELARLAVAVWLVDQLSFDEFHDYLFTETPSYSTAFAKATSMVDREHLNRTLQSTVPSDYIKKHITLYQRAGAGTIPKLLFPKTTAVGAVESPQAMAKLIEQNL